MAVQTKVGIVSVGEMGAAVAKLLVAHGYTVVTNITGRSEYTQKRAAAANIALLGTDQALVEQADYILSIVPPRDALATAKRFVAAASTSGKSRAQPLYYLDLNAVSPGRAKIIAAEFEPVASSVRFVDGGIIGGPPKAPEAGIGSAAASSEPGADWKRPSIPLSGPHPLPDEHLAKVLNTRYLGSNVGAASGLKCCFASMIKGLIALSLQSFSTAESLGVYDELQIALKHFQPHIQQSTTRMVTEIPPKAGRWVEEMHEIGRCFGEDGGWNNAKGGDGANVYERIAEVYRTIADDTVLGKERQEHRVRGKTSEDVSIALSDALHGKE
ncbi:hypothetical protein SEUCBS139899_009729 [Sporothrix eucalyptigena]|uniref:6-phosphogluconate dehydrogenase n=1 Tax=Sporothrix eucalyptigena TaxID=1812306 RepID=A0ABP0B3Q1_9PEZI